MNKFQYKGEVDGSVVLETKTKTGKKKFVKKLPDGRFITFTYWR